MTKTRLVLPFLASVLVLAALGLLLWPAPRPAEPSPEDAAAVEPAVQAAVGALASPARAAPAPAAAPVQSVATSATITDGAPPADLPEDPPSVNDPLPPEQPQTAAWRLEKTERMQALVARHVERLEQERAEALARGDRARAESLAVRVERERRRNDALRADAARLAQEARGEAGGKVE